MSAGNSAPERDAIMVDHPVVACDGGDPPLGHPRVFLRLVDGAITCPYCSRRYRLSPGAPRAGEH